MDFFFLKKQHFSVAPHKTCEDASQLQGTRQREKNPQEEKHEAGNQLCVATLCLRVSEANVCLAAAVAAPRLCSLLSLLTLTMCGNVFFHCYAGVSGEVH